MGYTTDFQGRFELDKPLTAEHSAFLHRFADTRRMGRDESITRTREDPIRKAVGLPLGMQGGYFVGELGDYGQGRGSDILDHNEPPDGQPGLWCKWEPSSDDKAIEWNEMEKFYDYVEWLNYLIFHFLKPWGYALNGEVEWNGEGREDIGKIVVEDNIVRALKGEIVYE